MVKKKKKDSKWFVQAGILEPKLFYFDKIVPKMFSEQLLYTPEAITSFTCSHSHP